MIHVLATLNVKPECLTDFLAIFTANVPAVLAEDGCLGYAPTLDLDSGLPPQVSLRPSTVTIIECWESLAALAAHLKAPHMAEYKTRTVGMVESVSLQVLKPV